jgi:hypothetical protein
MLTTAHAPRPGPLVRAGRQVEVGQGKVASAVMVDPSPGYSAMPFAPQRTVTVSVELVALVWSASARLTTR